MIVYVDDIIIFSSSPKATDALVHQLNDAFAIKNLGNLNFLVGIEVHRTKHGLLLTQRKYINDLLHRAYMKGCKSICTPMASTEKLSKEHGTKLTEEQLTQYRSIVGGLQCQFLHCPTDAHWSAVKRILRYLKRTDSYGLHICQSASTVLSAFADADWAGCPDDRRSTGGFAVFYGSNLISWN